MNKSTREPEYNKDKNFRIISAPNGLWQFQRLIDPRSKEDRKAGWQRGSDVNSPWEDVGMPQEYNVALGLLSARDMPQPKKAVDHVENS